MYTLDFACTKSSKLRGLNTEVVVSLSLCVSQKNSIMLVRRQTNSTEVPTYVAVPGGKKIR